MSGSSRSLKMSVKRYANIKQKNSAAQGSKEEDTSMNKRYLAPIEYQKKVSPDRISRLKI